MSKTSRVATAVAAGYVLGRFKKLRMAVMVGSALANDNVRNAALGYVKKGTGRFSSASSPGATLTQQVGAKLVDAGKAAALAAAASRVDSFSDRLATRSQSLRGADVDAPPEEESEPHDEYEDEAGPAPEEAEAEGVDEEDEEEAEEAEEPVTRSRRRGRSKSPARSGS